MCAVDKHAFQRDFAAKVRSLHGKDVSSCSDRELFLALADMVRERIGRRQAAAVHDETQKTIWYFSIEFLPGRLLRGYLFDLGIYEVCRDALSDMGIALERLEDQEEDAGIGNGGLGRLAACYRSPGMGSNLAVKVRYGLGSGNH